MKKGYKASRIIDGKGSQPHQKSVLIIDDDKIEGIAPEGKVGKDLPIFDLGDSTLLPGLIDSHVHLADDGSALPRKLVENEPGGLTLLRSAQRAFLSLRSGITALRDMGAPSGIMPALKDGVNLGVIKGPTVISCDTQLTITGGYGRKENVLGREVDGSDGMRKAVREVFKRGGDFIKIMASGKVSVSGPGLDAAQFTQEEMNAAVGEAHRLGRKVSVHAIGLPAVESSVRAGVDCVEHGNFLTKELAKEMVDRGIYLIPVLVPFYVLAHPPRELVLPEDVRKKAEITWRVTLEAVRMARDMGVKIGAGTDSGGPCIPHNSLARELELLVAAGLSAGEALTSATRVNAEILEVPEVGSLEKGKLADVVAVDGNPLEDIQAFSRVKMVLKNGREISRDSQIFE
jgi:imidazolonepropionase-like amidohydrolase